MIVGVGVDIAEVARLESALARTHGLRDRLFTPSERDLPPQSLAARFAAKEAVGKALGRPAELSWLDVEVVDNGDGAPGVVLSGRAREVAAELGVARWHLTLSHDAGLAIAFVVAEAGS